MPPHQVLVWLLIVHPFGGIGVIAKEPYIFQNEKACIEQGNKQIFREWECKQAELKDGAFYIK